VGVTAAASVVTYALHGHLDLTLAGPLVVGVLIGAIFGSFAMVKVGTPFLKRVFALVLFGIAVQMLWKGGEGLWTA
jgi:uncharacterized protein